MGEVYEAEDTELGERVAVKVVRPDIAENDEVMKRFRREVQLARRVTHPSVCRIYDLSRHPEGQGVVTLLSMELLQGRTLAQYLARKGPLSTAEAAPIVRQVLDGMTVAHSRGIVHGDLKSSNIFLVDEPPGPRAVVTDFGLARLASEAGAQRHPHLRPLMGSLASLAPEVLQGQEPTPRSDLYALGVLLFEMVTARLPFEGKGATELAACRLVEAPPSPRRWAPDLDSRWEEAILRCLAIEPEDRWADAPRLLAALGLDESGPAPATLGRAPRTRRPAWRGWLGGIAIAALVSLAAMGWHRSASDPPPTGERGGGGALASELPPPTVPRGASARSDAEQLFWEGMRLHTEFKEAAAVELFERAVELDPEFGMAWARLATAYSNLGRPGAREMAARALELTDQLSPSQRHYVRGIYHFERWHELRQSGESFRKAADLDSSNWAARHNLAGVLARLERFEEALEILRALVDDGADGMLAQGSLAIYLAQTGRNEESEQVLASSVADDPYNPAPWIQRGLLRLGRGWTEGAREDLEQAVSLHPGQADAELGLCLVDLVRDDPRAALARSRLMTGSAEPAAIFAAGSCRQLALVLAGRTREALDELGRSWSSIPEESKPVSALWWASLHMSRGEAELARERAALARSLAPGSWVVDYALYVEGRAALLSGDVDHARRCWRDIENRRDLAPQIARIGDLLAVDLLLLDGQVDRAVERIESIVAELPETPLATASPPSAQALVWETEARVALASGRPERAAELWHRIVDTRSGHLSFPGLYRQCLDHLVGYYREQEDAAALADLEGRLAALEARS